MKKTILSFLVIILAFLLHLTLVDTGKKQARIQNNFNLNSVITCITDTIHPTDPRNKSNHKNSQTSQASQALTTALNKCAKNQRSMGISGDIFVIRKNDKKLFWSSSEDCMPDNKAKLFMTEEGACALFKKPDTCIMGVNIMVENPPEGAFTWQFNDSIEYVNYRYLPIKIGGYEYIIGQGTQKDEVQHAFLLTYLVLISGSIVIILSIIF